MEKASMTDQQDCGVSGFFREQQELVDGRWQVHQFRFDAFLEGLLYERQFFLWFPV
jgi:hypothetical protein